jgi:hypothetical protein
MATRRAPSPTPAVSRGRAARASSATRADATRRRASSSRAGAESSSVILSCDFSSRSTSRVDDLPTARRRVAAPTAFPTRRRRDAATSAAGVRARAFPQGKERGRVSYVDQYFGPSPPSKIRRGRERTNQKTDPGDDDADDDDDDDDARKFLGASAVALVAWTARVRGKKAKAREDAARRLATTTTGEPARVPSAKDRIRARKIEREMKEEISRARAEASRKTELERLRTRAEAQRREDEVRPIHWFPYDPVRDVNVDP